EIRYGAEPRRDHSAEGEDPASTSDPVVFEIAPGRAVRLKGRIDRVEIAGDGSRLRVTDYKTGQLSRYRADSLAGGTTVPLPIYCRAPGGPRGAPPPGTGARGPGYLWGARRGGFKPVTFPAEALSGRRNALARVLSTFVNGVARGVFFASPEADTCRWCDYRL